MHTAGALAKVGRNSSSICKPPTKICKISGLREAPIFLSGVLATNSELLGRFDAHFDPAAGAAQQGDLNRTIGEKLCHGHVRVHALRRLDDDGFISTAAEN